MPTRRSADRRARPRTRRDAPQQPAIVDAQRASIDYGALDALMDRVAASLQRDGVAPGEAIAICARNSVAYAALFLGALRAGVVVAPLASSVTPASFHSMVSDAEARAPLRRRERRRTRLQESPARAHLLRSSRSTGDAPGNAVRRLACSGRQHAAGRSRFPPAMPFNIIYSSGNDGGRRRESSSRTGCAGRTSCAAAASATVADTVTLLATPLLLEHDARSSSSRRSRSAAPCC
jgi:acyl-CoA synthetase (AMP-forming)/AMP-acid ligase II